MKNYEQMEKDIVSLLKSNKELNLLAIIDSLPDNVADLNRNFTKPTIYIACTGSSFGTPENNFLVIQEETITFEAIIRAKTRIGKGGLFELITRVGDIILGFNLYKGCDRITLSQHGYIDSAQNDYNYSIKFNIIGKAVANQPDPDDINEYENAYPLKTPEFINKK